MNIKELIDKVGVEHLHVQNLIPGIITNVRTVRHSETREEFGEMSFVTDKILAEDYIACANEPERKLKEVGVVVWIPADKLPAEIMDQAANAPAPAAEPAASAPAAEE